MHSACLSQFLVSARLSQLQQQLSSASEMARDLCPACKQPLALQDDIISAVETAVGAAIKEAAAAAQAEMSSRARRDAEEREVAKVQRRKELLDKFSASPKCCVCVLANRSQSTKYFMHAFGTSPCNHTNDRRLTAATDLLPSAKFAPVECAHAYKNDAHLGQRLAFCALMLECCGSMRVQGMF
jgi:hypothetical protein